VSLAVVPEPTTALAGVFTLGMTILAMVHSSRRRRIRIILRGSPLVRSATDRPC
jgi:hypothetical protein